jgi:hypothetical protein
MDERDCQTRKVKSSRATDQVKLTSGEVLVEGRHQSWQRLGHLLPAWSNNCKVSLISKGMSNGCEDNRNI